MAEFTHSPPASAPPPLFKAEFDYTFEDYREAYAAQQRSLLPPGTFWKALGGWIAFVVLGGFLYLVLRWSAARGGVPIAPPPATPPIVATSPFSLRSVLLQLLPWVIIALVVARVIQKSTKGTGPHARPTYRPPVEQSIEARGPVVSGAISVAIAQAALLFAGAFIGHTRAGAANLADALAGMWPYALGVGAIVGLLIWAAQKQAVRKMWDGQPALHVRKTFVVRDEGFSIGDSSSVTQTKWVAVKRFIETPALFMLMLGDYTFHMVPKRALAGELGGDRALEEFRALLRMKVQTPTGAFPVMPASHAPPAASAPPLPMPPLPAGNLDARRHDNV